jgi:hypothetical protein
VKLLATARLVIQCCFNELPRRFSEPPSWAPGRPAAAQGVLEADNSWCKLSVKYSTFDRYRKKGEFNGSKIYTIYKKKKTCDDSVVRRQTIDWQRNC